MFIQLLLKKNKYPVFYQQFQRILLLLSTTDKEFLAHLQLLMRLVEIHWLFAITVINVDIYHAIVENGCYRVLFCGKQGHEEAYYRKKKEALEEHVVMVHDVAVTVDVFRPIQLLL